jgi:hypothetical protein
MPHQLGSDPYPYPRVMDELEIGNRQMALALAKDLAQHTAKMAADIVADARVFFAFLQGEEEETVELHVHVTTEAHSARPQQRAGVFGDPGWPFGKTAFG